MSEPFGHGYPQQRPGQNTGGDNFGWHSAPAPQSDGWQQYSAPNNMNAYGSGPTSQGGPAGMQPQYPSMQPGYAGSMPQTQMYPQIPLQQYPMGGNPMIGNVVGAPDMMAQVASNPMAQIGMAYAQQAVQRGMSTYLPGASMLWHSLRYYFDVSNQFVVKKLRRLLFPFRAGRWSRLTIAESGHPNRHGPSEGPGAADAFAAPIHDENAPDLYIPSMAFVTYVLLQGLFRGMLRTFHPDDLVAIASNGLVTAILETAVLKAGMYALAVDACPLWDLVAYGGYKYVALVVNCLAYLLLGSSVYTMVMLYMSMAFAYFLINSMMPLMRRGRGDGDALGGMGGPSRGTTIATKQRNAMVIIMGLMQILLIWWLGPKMAPGAAIIAGKT